MKMIEPESAARPWMLPRAEPRRAGPLDLDSVVSRLERLECAHELLLRYTDDLKRAYETERERRTQLGQAALGLMTVLANALPAE